MAQFSSLFFIICLTISSSVMATIVSMEELFHPKIQQTVILNADYHLKGDVHQIKDLLKLIRKNKFYFIVESPSDLPEKTNPNQYAPENVKNLLLNPNFLKEGTLLEALTCKIRSEDLTCYFPEFRKGYGGLVRVMKQSMNKSYIEKEQLWNSVEVKNAVYNAMFEARANAREVLTEIKTNLEELENGKLLVAEDIEMLRIELDELGNLYNQILDDVKAALPKEFVDHETDRDAMVSFMFKNRFINGEDGNVYINPESVFNKVQDMSCKLLDMRIIMHILQKQQEPVVVVCAGREHTENVRTILLKLGYEAKNKNEDDYVAGIALAEEISKKDPSFLNSEESITYETYRSICKLNIEEFIAACKTLKNNPPAEVAAAG